MKINLLILLLFISCSIFSQSKKEQIIILKNRVDSLTSILNIQDYAIEKNTIKITKLNSDLNLAALEISKCISESESKQNEIYKLRSEIDELRDSLSLLKSKNSKKFILPYAYGDKYYVPSLNKYFSTIYLNFINSRQILTDSLIVKLNENDILHFYFFTPISQNTDLLSCPENFGFLILNINGELIYNNFNPEGNSYLEYLEFDIGKYKRRLIGLFSSGCGSGGSIIYYELNFTNGKLTLEPKINSTSNGYETNKFLPEKNVYVQLSRINPVTHWGSENTKYSLTFYNLLNDEKLLSIETKLAYPHFGEEANLLKIIENKEPNLFKF